MTEKYEPQVGDIVSVTGTVMGIYNSGSDADIITKIGLMFVRTADLELVERPVKLPEIGSKWRHKIFQEQRKLTVAAHFENYVIVQWDYRSYPSVLTAEYLYMNYEPI